MVSQFLELAMSKFNKNFKWDDVLEVSNEGLRVKDTFKETVVIWKCSNESIARYVWTHMIYADTTSWISQIYRTGNEKKSFFEIAIVPVTLKTDITAIRLISKLGLWVKYRDTDMGVYVINPKKVYLKRWLDSEHLKKRYLQVVFALNRKVGFFMILFPEDDKPIMRVLWSFDEYMGFYKESTISLEQELQDVDDIEKNVSPELYQIMMYK